MTQRTSDGSTVPFLEAARRDLINDLEANWGSAGLEALSTIASDVEPLLEQRLHHEISKNSRRLLGCTKSANESFYVDPDTGHFELLIAPDIGAPGTLLITLQARELRPSRPTRNATIRMEGYGLYKTAQLIMPSSLSGDFDLLGELVQTLFETGYSWVQQRVERVVANADVALTKNLYAHLASVFPSSDVRRHIWFGTVTNGFGYRLLDPGVAKESFAIIDEHSASFGASTLMLVAELLNTQLPEQQLLMPKAIAQGSCMDVSLRDASYKKSGSRYASAMAALYGAEAFTIYPILRGDKVAVVALFPTTLRSEIEPILDHHVVDLRELCEVTRSQIVRLFSVFRPKPSDQFTKAGEFMGGFAAGWYKTLSG